MKYCESFLKGIFLMFGGFDFFLFSILLLFLLLVPGHISLEQSCGEDRVTFRPTQLALECSHVGFSLPGTAGWACAGENPWFTSYVTSPLWFVSCLANLCPWPQVSLDERIWVTASKHITTPRQAIINLCSVDGESC